jgi:hypothetical protein
MKLASDFRDLSNPDDPCKSASATSEAASFSRGFASLLDPANFMWHIRAKELVDILLLS